MKTFLWTLIIGTATMLFILMKTMEGDASRQEKTIIGHHDSAHIDSVLAAGRIQMMEDKSSQF